MPVFAGILDFFVNPWLLGGLVLLSSPIIIHLLNKRHYTVVDWAAMDFLLNADSRNRRRLRLEDLLLLLLRLALLGLVVFAVARPMVQGVGGAMEDERIVILDDSFSMDASEGTGTAFLRAKAAAVQQVEEAVGRSVPVSVWSGTRPELGAMALRLPAPGSVSIEESSGVQEGAARLLDDLRGRETTDVALRLGPILSRLAERFEDEKQEQQRVVTIVSDLRASDWLEPGGTALRSEVEASILDLKKRGQLESIRWKLIDTGQPINDNVAVTQVRVAAAHPLARVPTRIVVEVHNFGDQERKHVTGTIEVQELAAGSSAVTSETVAVAPAGEGFRQQLRTLHRIPLPALESIPAGKSAAFEVDFTFERAGIYPIAARIEADRLPRDDSGFAVAHVRQGLRTLVVDGDPGEGRFSGESGFLLPAMAPRGALPSGILPQRFVGELTARALHDIDVALILNRASLSPGEQTVLTEFVKSGGGVAFFLGNRVTKDSYRGLEVFPAELQALVEAKPRLHLRLGADPQAGFAVFKGIEGSSLEKVGFDRYFQVLAAPGAAIVATFDDAGNTAAVIEKTLGRGRAVVFNMTADRDWSDWPTDPSYPIVLQEWVRNLAPRRSLAAQTTAGEPMVWEPAAGIAYSVLPPTGPLVQVEIPTRPGGQRLVSHAATHRAGFYVVFSAARAPGSETSPEALATRVFACQRDSRESNLELAGEPRLRAALSAVGVEFVLGRDPAADSLQLNDENEIWRFLSYAAGIVLVLELLVAWWFGRR